MTITVVVCAYNEAVLLPGCLYSLLSQTRPPDEILVINNAITDATGAVARAVLPLGSAKAAGGSGRRLEAANRDDLFSVTSLKHYPYVAKSDFHKPKHLYSWKTLLRCEKTWDAIGAPFARTSTSP
jgi:Glycosyl transferase family 2